jgi:hypothetical protein
MFTISSGADVPKDTTVKPIIKSLRPTRFAIDEAPSTSQSAPLISRMNPPTRYTRGMSITKIIERLVDNE